MSTSDPAHVALLDQFDAAAADANRYVRNLGKAMGPNAIEDSDARWAGRIMAERTGLLLSEEGLLLCPHILAGPAPAFVPSWQPVICCGDCFASVPRPTLEQDCTCDECGAIGDQPVHEAAAQFGPLVILGGVCEDCFAKADGLS